MQKTPPPTASILSKREKEVVVCVALGLLTKEVANFLSISVKTVEKHRSAIYEKIGLNKMGGRAIAPLTLWAIKNGIISVPRISTQEHRVAA